MNKRKLFLLSLCIFFVLGCVGCAKEEGLKVPKRGSLKKGKRQQEPGQVSPAQPQAAAAQKEEPQGRINAFLTKEEEEAADKAKDIKIPINYLELSAIIYSSGERKALIGGKIFKEGDILDNKVIEKISAEEVILKDSQGEYVIRLKDVINKGS